MPSASAPCRRSSVLTQPHSCGSRSRCSSPRESSRARYATKCSSSVRSVGGGSANGKCSTRLASSSPALAVCVVATAAAAAAPTAPPLRPLPPSPSSSPAPSADQQRRLIRSARACAASRPIIAKYAGCAQSVARMRQHCSADLPLSGSAAAGSTSCTRCAMVLRVSETVKTEPTLAAAETSSCSPLTRSGFCSRFASRLISIVLSSWVHPLSSPRLRSRRNRVVPSRSRRVSMAALNSFSFRAFRLSVRSLTSSAASSSSFVVRMPGGVASPGLPAWVNLSFTLGARATAKFGEETNENPRQRPSCLRPRALYSYTPPCNTRVRAVQQPKRVRIHPLTVLPTRR
eukprot:scaffold18060_cov60-Phaeocystis_antarctica.AAC.2